jgi:putative selenate reductase
MNWIVTEYAATGDIFGVHKGYRATGKSLPIFGERIETPFGPAAGPNSQLAQNIIASYFAGARFFEVKTVQKMDGEELAACVPRPCILATDECYNQEWSTELTVQQAQDEYIKAWCALKVLSKVYGLGDSDGFVFNMSVGYDLAGIKGKKVNSYIDNMMDARKTPQFKECLAVLKEFFPEEKDFIAGISPKVSRSVTASAAMQPAASTVRREFMYRYPRPPTAARQRTIRIMAVTLTLFPPPRPDPRRSARRLPPGSGSFLRSSPRPSG